MEDLKQPKQEEYSRIPGWTIAIAMAQGLLLSPDMVRQVQDDMRRRQEEEEKKTKPPKPPRRPNARVGHLALEGSF